MSKVVKTFQYGQHQVSLETGEIAKQAHGSVIARMGDTMVLVTVVGKSENPGNSFFPLTIEVEERSYAAGKIPGGFFKREGRPSENAILMCRLIDRPLRPLFPEGFMNEVQVIVTILSIDPEVNPDVLSMIGASAALEVSGIPFNGPVGAARVGYVNGEYVLNPSDSVVATESKLDLIVAGTENAVLMVESEADILSEEQMLGAVMYGHEQSKAVIQAIKELGQMAGKPKWQWQAAPKNVELQQQVKQIGESRMSEAYQIADKMQRQDAIAAIRSDIETTLNADKNDELGNAISDEIKSLEKDVVRSRILRGEPRIDGRDTKTVRPIKSEIGVLPRAHGSAVFTRGETQALVVTTLGTERDAQVIDALAGEYKDAFMLHYNFPPFCVGETGRVGTPKRREIGHGRLAKRGIKAVIPSQEEFPYTIRTVSEITESNGSSSMASVCGTSLALMDAGVKIKAPVAGVAMGLIKTGDQHAVITDILGDEDHLGDMDFKVAGTSNGITALQMDIKIDGITRDIMETALAQAKDGRITILNEMAKVISEPRTEMSDFAPRITTIKINPEKIRDVIGKGGATIRSISEEYGVSIDIEDDGTVKVASADSQASEAAINRIQSLTAEIEVDSVYDGTVVRLMEFGAFVNILPGKDGLVHISQISNDRVEQVSHVLKEGDKVRVKVLEVDKQGRIRLSMKALADAV